MVDEMRSHVLRATLSLLFLCWLLAVPGDCFYRTKGPSIPPVGDNGEPLFLTPLLEKGAIEKAKQLARVPPLAGNVLSYAGFFTVNKTYNSNHFFWFFPASRNSNSAPVVVWLQGGPGASSMFGLFGENGPYGVKESGTNKTVFLRKYSWTKTLSMLYIDNPVGTGYSFTNHDQGYCTCEEDVAENLYRTIEQFFQLFPKLSNNHFYVAGESYGGKYAPALAYAIHQRNQNSQTRINLKGVAIGNGYSDPVNMLSYGDYLYQIGLIDATVRNTFNDVKGKTRQLILAGKMEEAFETWDAMLNGDLIKRPSLFTNATGFTNYFNYLQSSGFDDSAVNEIVQQSSVRGKIHVGNLTFHTDQSCEIHLRGDMMRSVAPWVKELLDNGYKFLAYNGQLDIIVAYPLTVEFLSNLDWSGSKDYKNTTRRIWKVDDKDKEVAGYVRIVRNLAEVLVRNAGHMVPVDQPRAAYDLIRRFAYDELF